MKSSQMIVTATTTLDVVDSIMLGLGIGVRIGEEEEDDEGNLAIMHWYSTLT